MMEGLGVARGSACAPQGRAGLNQGHVKTREISQQLFPHVPAPIELNYREYILHLSFPAVQKAEEKGCSRL